MVAVVLLMMEKEMVEKEDQVLITHLVVMVLLQAMLEIMVVVLPLLQTMDRDRMVK